MITWLKSESTGKMIVGTEQINAFRWIATIMCLMNSSIELSIATGHVSDEIKDSHGMMQCRDLFTSSLLLI